jgi:hypothetical protein
MCSGQWNSFAIAGFFLKQFPVFICQKCVGGKSSSFSNLLNIYSTQLLARSSHWGLVPLSLSFNEYFLRLIVAYTPLGQTVNESIISVVVNQSCHFCLTSTWARLIKFGSGAAGKQGRKLIF